MCDGRQQKNIHEAVSSTEIDVRQSMGKKHSNIRVEFDV